ncbi:M15 family metallopeptidase [uncultured Jatrophihabitans sp.]|uniref:M15 family metallopeptidase n=1 Tax=uncultured Jatrophihabitans sp. TaxID=1610747 RepID=UPI0035CB260D
MTDYAHLAHFGNYNPASFGWGGENDPVKHPHLLVPFHFDGAYYGLMHRDAVPVFTAVFTELVPHIPGGVKYLDKHHDEGCFNNRSKTTGGGRSFHGYGIATDTNWDDNPMYGTPHHGRPGVMPAITHEIARKYGCEWGGDWSYPQDWMHIEIHLSPGNAAKVRHLGDSHPAPAPKPVSHPASPKPYPFGHDDVFGPLKDPSRHVHGGYTAMERDYVRLIKSRFVKFGYLTQHNSDADGNGIWGPHTSAACEHFDRRMGYRKITNHMGRGSYTDLMSTKARHA